jgi:biopolymer transport protein ExbB
MILELIKTHILNQNPLILTLGLLSALALAVIVDRLLFWMGMGLRYRPIPPDIYRRNRRMRYDMMQRLQYVRGKHYINKVVNACLEPGTTDEQITQTVSEQIARMNTHLGLLDLIAKIAPLIGILGTVLGMATSFGGVGAMDAASPTVISGGISVALRTTAYGLVISIASTVSSVGFKCLTERAVLKIGRIYCEIKQVENVTSRFAPGEPSQSEHRCRPDTHAGHDLSDHPVATGDPDAQFRCAGLSSELPELC